MHKSFQIFLKNISIPEFLGPYQQLFFDKHKKALEKIAFLLSTSQIISDDEKVGILQQLKEGIIECLDGVMGNIEMAAERLERGPSLINLLQEKKELVLLETLQSYLPTVLKPIYQQRRQGNNYLQCNEVHYISFFWNYFSRPYGVEERSDRRLEREMQEIVNENKDLMHKIITHVHLKVNLFRILSAMIAPYETMLDNLVKAALDNNTFIAYHPLRSFMETIEKLLNLNTLTPLFDLDKLGNAPISEESKKIQLDTAKLRLRVVFLKAITYKKCLAFAMRTNLRLAAAVRPGEVHMCEGLIWLETNSGIIPLPQGEISEHLELDSHDCLLLKTTQECSQGNIIPNRFFESLKSINSKPRATVISYYLSAVGYSVTHLSEFIFVMKSLICDLNAQKSLLNYLKPNLSLIIKKGLDYPLDILSIIPDIHPDNWEQMIEVIGLDVDWIRISNAIFTGTHSPLPTIYRMLFQKRFINEEIIPKVHPGIAPDTLYIHKARIAEYGALSNKYIPTSALTANPIQPTHPILERNPYCGQLIPHMRQSMMVAAAGPNLTTAHDQHTLYTGREERYSYRMFRQVGLNAKDSQPALYINGNRIRVIGSSLAVDRYDYEPQLKITRFAAEL